MVDVGQGRLGILTISEHPGMPSVTWTPGTGCGELSSEEVWDPGPRHSAGHGAENPGVSTSTRRCRLRGSWRAETKRRMSRLPRVLLPRALATGTDPRNHRVSLHQTAARGGAGIMAAPSQPLAVRRDTGRRESNIATEIAAARWGWQICPAQHNLRSRAGVRWP